MLSARSASTGAVRKPASVRRERVWRHVIIRTAWVFGAYGSNFVKTMLRLGTERPVLRVVADQLGCPTAAADIAAALVVIARHIERGETKWGTYHFAGDRAVTWYGFAEAIFNLSVSQLTACPQIEAITSDQYPTPARRPMNSILDCRKIQGVFGIRPSPWRERLASVIREVLGPTP
jgi:dTDP-4-dehydrorhamnose reductase